MYEIQASSLLWNMVGTQLENIDNKGFLEFIPWRLCKEREYFFFSFFLCKSIERVLEMYAKLRARNFIRIYRRTLEVNLTTLRIFSGHIIQDQDEQSEESIVGLNN